MELERGGWTGGKEGERERDGERVGETERRRERGGDKERQRKGSRRRGRESVGMDRIACAWRVNRLTERAFNPLLSFGVKVFS